MSNKALSDRISIDDASDIVTIDGVQFSGEALSFFTEASPEGRWYRFTGPKHGVQMVECRTDEGFK